MKHSVTLFSVLLIAIIVMLGCAGGNGDPLTPASETGLTGDREATGVQTQLWGYYNLNFDFDKGTVDAVVDRNAMYTLNINTFLNSNPATLGFVINDVENTPAYLQIDMDVSITHPLPGKPQFNGYDVRGTLITDAGMGLLYNPDLLYPTLASNQYLINADGYTRWFNKPEFINPGIGGFIHGIYGTKILNGDSTINPYKYFTDGILATDDPYNFLFGNPGGYGVFSSGVTNTRNYLLRFPKPTPGVKYDYSILASWQSATVHPANAPESVACDVEVTDNIYYVDGTDWGGNFIADISLFYWDTPPTQIYIESTVFSAPYALTPTEMVPVSSGTNNATWHVGIPSDNVTGTDGNEYWIIAEYGGNDYSGPFGIPNNVGSDPLAAFYRFDLFVADTPPVNGPPVINSGVDGSSTFYPDSVEVYTVDASDPDLDTLTYTWEAHCVTTSGYEFTGPGDGLGDFTIDWAVDVGAEIGMEFEINCEVTDSINPPVMATTHVAMCVEEVNLPPEITDGVSGDPAFAPDSVKEYTVTATDPNMDTLTYTFETHCMTTSGYEFSGPGDGLGGFTIDWANDVGATAGMEFLINCDVSDGVNPPVSADVLAVICEESTIITLYLYDGMVDDGGIVDGTWDDPTWAYCPSINAWDEYECGNYPDFWFSICRTPYITFPDPGTFTAIHLEIWHWGNMPENGDTYGDVGTCYDDGGLDYQAPNWIEEALVYIDGMDFNDPSYEDFIGTYGSESSPAHSHFDCSAYAGNTYGIALACEEWNGTSGDAYEGWNIRKIHIWVEP